MNTMFGGFAVPDGGADDPPGADDTEDDDVDEDGDALGWLLHDAATNAVATTTLPIRRRRRRVLREPSVTVTTLRSTHTGRTSPRARDPDDSWR
jgi:hypothetical protein